MTESIRKAQAGDEQAFEQLVQLHKTKLTATAYAYTKDYMAAQDVVQNTLILAYKALPQLKEPAYFSTWLYKILIRQCFQYLQVKKRDASLTFELQQLQLTQSEATPHFDELYAAINGLKKQYKTVVLLHYFYDFKLQEIAHLIGKPLNTVKIQLHRARLLMKKQLEQQTKQTMDVNRMLTNLQQAALQYVKIPESYTLSIEEIDEDGGIFLWKENETDEGYYISVSPTGKLLSLSQPVQFSGEALAVEALQQIAENFLTAQYEQALQYYTLGKVTKKEESYRFSFKQLVGGIPLQSAYCSIEVLNDGQLMNFEYKPYEMNPPAVPKRFAPTAPIVEQLRRSDWTLQLEYLSDSIYNVPKSGLYVVYHSSFLYNSFDAVTGEDLSQSDDDDEIELPVERFEPIRHVASGERLTRIEDIIGLPPSMKRIRESESDRGYVGIVWRDESYIPTEDKSMNQFMLDRFEDTVKANVHAETGELRGFVWFKERNGDLDLSFEACEQIALTFIHTYYPHFVPFMKMKVKDPDFNEANRAFFYFQLEVQKLPLQGEYFMLSVNKTTGRIDSLMGTQIDVRLLQDFIVQPVLPLADALDALGEVDAVPEWNKRYGKENEEVEKLIYRYKHKDTHLQVKYIDAVSGRLITAEF